MHTTHIVHKSKSATTQNYRLYFTKLLYIKSIKIRTDKSMCTHNIHIASTVSTYVTHKACRHMY